MKLQLPEYFHHENKFWRYSPGLIKNKKPKQNQKPPTLEASPASSLKELGKTRIFSPQSYVKWYHRTKREKHMKDFFMQDKLSFD